MRFSLSPRAVIEAALVVCVLAFISLNVYQNHVVVRLGAERDSIQGALASEKLLVENYSDLLKGHLAQDSATKRETDQTFASLQARLKGATRVVTVPVPVATPTPASPSATSPASPTSPESVASAVPMVPADSAQAVLQDARARVDAERKSCSVVVADCQRVQAALRAELATAQDAIQLGDRTISTLRHQETLHRFGVVVGPSVTYSPSDGRFHTGASVTAGFRVWP